MKPNTKRSAKEALGPATFGLLMTTPGARSQIAAIGGFSRGHVSNVLAGRKRPSRRFREAVAQWIFALKKNAAIEMAERDLKI